MKSAEQSHAKKFILEALHLTRDLPSSGSWRRMQATDWVYLSNMARLHRLGPILHHRLCSTSHQDAMPVAVRDQLKAAQRSNTLRNLRLYRELVTVTRNLQAGGIPCIALKGAYLARFVYPDSGLRPMRDLDLLVKPEQALQAFELLKAHGYSAYHDGLPEVHLLDKKHLPPLKGAAGINIELHHRLSDPNPGLIYPADFIEKLWARSISRVVGGTEIRFLAPEDLLLHLCIHASIEHQFDLGPLALADVAFLVETHQLDWQEFVEHVTSLNWQRGVLPMLMLVTRHLGAKIPHEVLCALDDKKSAALWLESAEYLLFSDPEDHKLLNSDVQEVLYSGSLYSRLRTLLGIVFPPRTVISRHFSVSPDSARVFFYYPRRWHRLASQKLPLLLKGVAGRNQSIRRLARHRSTLNDWVHEHQRGR